MLGLSSSPQRAGSGTRPRWTTHSRPQTTDVMDVAHGYDGAPSGPTEIQPLEEGVEPNVHRALCFWGKNAMNKSPPHHESTGKRTDEQVSGTGEGGGAGHPEPRTEPAREGLRCQSRPGESRKTPYNERPRSMTLDF